MIEVRDVVKTYQKGKTKSEVLKGISFCIPDGEIVALLGHNGSGKSTLLKCMTGVIKPTQGAVFLDGRDVFAKQKSITKEIGVVFNQKPSFIVDLTVMDNLLFFKTIYDIPDKEFEEMLALVDQYLNVHALYQRPYRKLSFGERVKCEITSVLLHKPKYLFLDEPTIGLDYSAKKGLYQLLRYFNETCRTTVLVVTHEVDYIQGICRRAVIISEGTLRYNGTADSLSAAVKERLTMSIRYEAVKEAEAAERLFSVAEQADRENQVLLCRCENAAEKDRILQEAVAALAVTEIKTEKPSLREVLENVLEEVRQSD